MAKFYIVMGLFILHFPGYLKGELFLMDTTKIGYSEVLLYPHSELDYNGSVNMGSLATSTNIGVGVVAAVLGQSATPLLVTILEEMGTRLVMTELHLWDFEEGHCWFTLVDESGMINQSAIELDMQDLARFTILSVPNDSHPNENIPSSLGEISVFLANVTEFEYYEHLIQEGYSLKYTFVVKYIGNLSNYEAEVSFNLILCSSACSSCNITASLSIGCNSKKTLELMYPRFLNQSDFYNLQANYRPPSHHGEAIFTSPHIYNVDPSQSLSQIHTKFSQKPMYKQCSGGNDSQPSFTLGNECNCSEEDVISTDILHSDCIRKVYKYPFIAAFSLNFYITINSSEDSRENVSSNLVFITELNNRTDFLVKLGPSNITEIIFMGSGLYHYNASLNSSSNTFCKLHTQFIVYVEGSPLLEVEDVSIVVLTSVACGLGTLLVYLYFFQFRLSPNTLQMQSVISDTTVNGQKQSNITAPQSQ